MYTCTCITLSLPPSPSVPLLIRQLITVPEVPPVEEKGRKKVEREPTPPPPGTEDISDLLLDTQLIVHSYNTALVLASKLVSFFYSTCIFTCICIILHVHVHVHVYCILYNISDIFIIIIYVFYCEKHACTCTHCILSIIHVHVHVYFYLLVLLIICTSIYGT